MAWLNSNDRSFETFTVIWQVLAMKGQNTLHRPHFVKRKNTDTKL